MRVALDRVTQMRDSLHLGGIVHGGFRHSYLLYASDLPSWDDVVGGRNLALIWDHEFLDMAVV